VLGVKELWEMSADGSGMHRLLQDWRPQADSFNGNWTPDGKYFVFQSRDNGRADLWAIPERGDFFHKTKHEPVQLTSGPLSFYSAQPSQDGKHIFAIGEQPRGELQRFDAKSGRFVPYLDGVSATGLDFSRDGRWVAYTTYPEQILWRSRID
jgi:Tol biopolymer transport system component